MVEIGNISEIVGAIAVVVSIIYLAIQVRENTRATVLAATRELCTQGQLAATANVEDAEIADIWLVGVRNRNDLNHLDGFRFSQTVAKAFHVWEQQYFHLKENLIHKELFDTQLESWRLALVWTGVRDWWQSNQQMFTEDFRNHVNRIAQDSPLIEPSEYESFRGKKMPNKTIESDT